MRVVFLGNNKVGAAVLRAIVDAGDDVVATVLHPEARRSFSAELADATPKTAQVFDGARLADSDVLGALAALRPDIAVSALFGYIVRRPFIDLFPRGVVNLHSALLPYNRGAHPNVWSIIDRTPAGVTLHLIDEGVDTGPVLAQRAVDVLPHDTGETLYRRLEEALLRLFVDSWPALRDGKLAPQSQEGDKATVHRVRDLDATSRIDLDAPTTARALLDRIRARTFPPHHGCWFDAGDGRRVYVSLKLEPAEDLT